MAPPSGRFNVAELFDRSPTHPREALEFSGLALGETLAAKKVEARGGLLVIDLKTGDTVHWLRVEGVVEELYDVVALPGTRRPMALGFKTDEIRRTITLADPPSPLLSAS